MFDRLAPFLVCAWFSSFGTVGCLYSVDAPTEGADGLAPGVETFPVTGKVILNGGSPRVGPDCIGSPNAEMVTLTFFERDTGAFVVTSVRCSADDFRFETELTSGTWKVAVSPYVAGRSNLPDGAFVADEAFDVTGAVSDVSFDVETVTVSGAVTLDGRRPVLGPDCADAPSFDALTLTFVDRTSGATATSSVSCSATDFTFSAHMSPGIYRATVAPYVEGRSNVPNEAYVVDSELRVSGPTAGAILDVKPLAR